MTVRNYFFEKEHHIVRASKSCANASYRSPAPVLTSPWPNLTPVIPPNQKQNRKQLQQLYLFLPIDGLIGLIFNERKRASTQRTERQGRQDRETRHRQSNDRRVGAVNAVEKAFKEQVNVSMCVHCRLRCGIIRFTWLTTILMHSFLQFQRRTHCIICWDHRS